MDELHDFGFHAAPGADEQPGVHEARVTGRERNRVCLLDQSRGRGELAAEQVHT